MNNLLKALGLAAPLLSLSLSGCAASEAETKPVAQFPSRTSLSSIAAKPVVAPALPDNIAPGDGWQLDPALPELAGDDPWQPQSAWETAFAEMVAQAERAPRLTRTMSCAAREIGRFYLERGAAPPEGLSRYLLGACGILAPRLSGVACSTGTLPPTATDEQALEQWGGQIRGGVREALRARPSAAGFWFGRREASAVMCAAFIDQSAQIKPFAPVPDARGEVAIEGRLDVPVAYFEAYINKGRFGAERCSLDMSVPRPAFRAVCRPAADDETAWIQLFYASPMRVLATPFAQVLVRRSVDQPLVYRETAYAAARPVSSAQEFSRAVLDQLNGARREAGLRPVALAPRQSDTAAQLSPHYFAAATGAGGARDEQQMDVIALGLLAGWDVQGEIRDADFISNFMTSTLDAGRWLNAALTLPIGRRTFFAPETEQVALGPLLLHGPDAIGAVVAGYRFHHGADHAGDAQLLMSRVVDARRRMGLSPPKRLGTMDAALREELAPVNQGTATPSEALQAVLHRGVDAFESNMRGYAIETTSLEALELPPDLLRQPTLHLEIGVTHHKPRGAAWAQFTILVIFADYRNNQI